MAALDAVFEDRDGAVFAEIVFVNAAADEAAAFVEGDLPESRVARTDFEQAEPRPGATAMFTISAVKGRVWISTY